MTCEFAKKIDGKIRCLCNNLAHGLINGKPVNVASSLCEENPNCYYKLWKRSERKGERNE
ncbi:MAG: hypothetical protein J6V44_09115 [Methanobrevibacter sp.]|nr:hypothetical protein [Methanobrevibacter sp.]